MLPIKLNVVQPLLLRWFRKNKRPLPWRKTRDPYAIWVSEIMLQQTQVNTVIPYYERWMKQFPTVQQLSEAPLSRVLKLWEGLGYYGRARNLHKSAKIIDKKLAGEFPNTSEKLRALPGIGRYTAGAIASIAFGERAPVLDGNVMRVLSRIFAVKEPVDQTEGKKKLWEIAERLVWAGLPRPYNPGDFNQSLMELGALVCLPENPKCLECPGAKICEAHRLKKEVLFPVRNSREKGLKLNTVAAVIWNKRNVLLQKQPLDARWGGLWMFPHWIYTNGIPETKFLQEKIKREFGIKAGNLIKKQEIIHGFTKYRVRLQVYETKVGARRAVPLQSDRPSTFNTMTRWVSPQKLPRLALPRPHQKIAQSLNE